MRVILFDVLNNYRVRLDVCGCHGTSSEVQESILASIGKANEVAIVTLHQVRADFSKAGLSETFPDVSAQVPQLHWPDFLQKCHDQVSLGHPYATYSKEIIAATSGILREPSSGAHYSRWLQMQGLALVVPADISCVMSLCRVAVAHSLEQRVTLLSEMLALHGAVKEQPPWLLGPWCVQGKHGGDQAYASLVNAMLAKYTMAGPVTADSPFPQWDRFYGAVEGIHKALRLPPDASVDREANVEIASLSSAILTAITWIELRKSLPRAVEAWAQMKPWVRLLDPHPLTCDEAVQNALCSIEEGDPRGSKPSDVELTDHKKHLDGIFSAAWTAARPD